MRVRFTKSLALFLILAMTQVVTAEDLNDGVVRTDPLPSGHTMRNCDVPGGLQDIIGCMQQNMCSANLAADENACAGSFLWSGYSGIDPDCRDTEDAAYTTCDENDYSGYNRDTPFDDRRDLRNLCQLGEMFEHTPPAIPPDFDCREEIVEHGSEYLDCMDEVRSKYLHCMMDLRERQR